jgi:hypothetical protein
MEETPKDKYEYAVLFWSRLLEDIEEEKKDKEEYKDNVFYS